MHKSRTIPTAGKQYNAGGTGIQRRPVAMWRTAWLAYCLMSLREIRNAQGSQQANERPRRARRAKRDLCASERPFVASHLPSQASRALGWRDGGVLKGHGPWPNLVVLFLIVIVLLSTPPVWHHAHRSQKNAYLCRLRTSTPAASQVLLDWASAQTPPSSPPAHSPKVVR